MNIYFSPKENREWHGIYHLKVIWLVDEDTSYAVQRPDETDDVWVAVRTLGGAGLIRLRDGSILKAAAESVLLIPREQISDYHTDGERWFFYWLEFTTRVCFSGYCAQVKAALFETAVIEQVCYSLSAGNEKEAQSGFQYLLAHWESDMERPKEGNLARAAAHMIDCSPIDTPLTPQQLAEQFHVSERTLRKHFLETFNMTPHTYIRRRRMETAKHLLTTTSWTVREIAAKVGLEDEFYFSRCFKAETGHSPSHYRIEKPS